MRFLQSEVNKVPNACKLEIKENGQLESLMLPMFDMLIGPNVLPSTLKTLLMGSMNIETLPESLTDLYLLASTKVGRPGATMRNDGSIRMISTYLSEDILNLIGKVGYFYLIKKKIYSLQTIRRSFKK